VEVFGGLAAVLLGGQMTPAQLRKAATQQKKAGQSHNRNQKNKSSTLALSVGDRDGKGTNDPTRIYTYIRNRQVAKHISRLE
jgi:hypothetical protein